MEQINLTAQDLSAIFNLFVQGIGIGGLLSGLFWIVGYTTKKTYWVFSLSNKSTFIYKLLLKQAEVSEWKEKTA